MLQHVVRTQYTQHVTNHVLLLQGAWGPAALTSLRAVAGASLQTHCGRT